MKILYVITSADHGGAQKYVLALAAHFKGTIVAGNEAAWLFDEAAKRGIPTIRLKHLKREISPLNDFLAISELKKLIAKEQPDLLHLNSTKAGVIGSLAAKKHPKTKVIYTVHGFILNEPLGALKRALYGFLERLAAKYRAYTIAVSKADYAALLAAGAASQNALKVVYNGLEPIDFLGRSAARQQLNLPAEGFIVGTIANFYKTKGLDILIEAIAALPSDVASYKLHAPHFVIIGSGPEQKNLQQLIANRKLQNIVQLVTNQANAARLLKAFDLFVLPSRKEGMPFALLEALSAGLPIVATNVGGVREVLGNEGFIVAPQNSQALHDVLEMVINEPARLIPTSLSAEFSAEEMFSQTSEVYAKVLQSNEK